MSHKSDAAHIASTRNTARFFTENPHISWIALVVVLLWGVYGYLEMPKRKDPLIPGRVAVAVTPWPGANAGKVERLVTRKVEEKVAENAKVSKIESISRTGVSIVYAELDDRAADSAKEFDDIKLRLLDLDGLPEGAGPVQFVRDFEDTAALMLTVASPEQNEVELAVRAQTVAKAIAAARGARPDDGKLPRVAGVALFPPTLKQAGLRRQIDSIAATLEKEGLARDVRLLEGAGFLGLDFQTAADDAALEGFVARFLRERLRVSELHPDVCGPAFIRDPARTEHALKAIAGDKYSYGELDAFTDLIKRTLQTAPQVSKVARAGLIPERIYLDYSQEQLAAYDLQPSQIEDVLSARSGADSGGMIEIEGKNLPIEPSGELRLEDELRDVVVSSSAKGQPVYLRDLITIERGYESPPTYVNFLSQPDKDGKWRRSRAITLAVQMRPGEQIDAFSAQVNNALDSLKGQLPDDLILARSSDQPLQVKESVDLFMKSLYEAIGLVVLVALIGFWEWRSALLMSLSIPLTLAMTFGMMRLIGMDLQQVSIASLILALGLLVDDPIVAGDAIKRELDKGLPRRVAAWLGPTKLATAILYATITNIVAYLPLLLISGDTGRFIYALPIVLTCSLVASRLVSMTFIPSLGYALLRPSKQKPGTPHLDLNAPKTGFVCFYTRVCAFCLEHRWAVFLGSLLVPVAGYFLWAKVPTQFFPKDLSYLCYVDVWLPEDAPLAATDAAAARCEAVIRDAAAAYGVKHPDKNGASRPILERLTTFVGGGGPRFWFSASPEMEQLNYAQILIQVKDKHDTAGLVPKLQAALSSAAPGARVDVMQLETGNPVGIPVAVRFSGKDEKTLRGLADKAKAIFESLPMAERVRDDWGSETFAAKLRIDPDRSQRAGISNLDVAMSSAAAMSGRQVGILREDERRIPLVARLRLEERARLEDIRNLYVHSLRGPGMAPLSQVADVSFTLQAEKIRRRGQFRTITVACFPVSGVLPSQVMEQATARLTALEKELSPGYKMEIGGEFEEQAKGFTDMAIAMLVSIIATYLALVMQFKNAVKPLIVFGAIPYGVVGAIAGLAVMQSPFGFMAFLGVASLVGVIVSHVIVKFDFIEEMREHGVELRRALIDAGAGRLRPVMITVGATIFGLIPLALHGGPLWEPLCYTQIGGLALATFITLLLVPVMYAICVLDLKIVKWAPDPTSETTPETTATAPEA